MSLRRVVLPLPFRPMTKTRSRAPMLMVKFRMTGFPGS